MFPADNLSNDLFVYFVYGLETQRSTMKLLLLYTLRLEIL